MGMPQTLQLRWAGLAERERWLVRLAVGLVVLALLWSLGIAPALRVVQTAGPRMEQLDRQLHQMEGLAAQARALQARAPVSRDEAVRALQSSLQQRMGSQAQMSNAGDRVTVTMSGVAPPVLAQWLGQARAAARVVVAQARLTRGATGWDGSIILQLPVE